MPFRITRCCSIGLRAAVAWLGSLDRAASNRSCTIDGTDRCRFGAARPVCGNIMLGLPGVRIWEPGHSVVGFHPFGFGRVIGAFGCVRDGVDNAGRATAGTLGFGRTKAGALDCVRDGVGNLGRAVGRDGRLV